MRTLQEKYNGINEGTFTKDQFLRDARLQLPNLITQYNGFVDAVQILKNRGMIREAFSTEESFKEYSDDALIDMVVNSSRFEGNEETLARVKAELSRRKGVQEGESTSNRRQVGDKVSVYGTNNTTYLYSGEVLSVDGDNVTVGKFSGARPSTGDSQITVPLSRVRSGKDLSTNEKVVKEDDSFNFSDGQKIKNKNSGAICTVDGKDNSGGIYVRTEKGLRRNVPAEHFSIYEPVNETETGNTDNIDYEKEISFIYDVDYVPEEIDVYKGWPEPYRAQALKALKRRFANFDAWANDRKQSFMESKKELKEARLTNKSLTDYRYKPTNDLDKYPYEQILRGLRVELEGMQVTSTPTTDEYKKALAKVLKNLHADEIFYTNQLAGNDKKVDNHDQLVSVQGKEKEIKNSIDTYNGLKKAALKEGFKTLIKKVLNEDVDPLRDYIKSKEDHSPKSEVENYKKENDDNVVNEAPAVNNPKIEKLVIGINELISKAIDQDGDPIGVIWPGGTWDEPYVYEPIQYRNGQLKITSKSVYGGQPETDTVLSREMEIDGIPMLRTLMRMYKKAVRKFTEAVKTKCQTPDAQFNIKIKDDKVSVEVELPMKLDLTEDEVKLLESNIHNAMELVLAQYFKNSTKPVNEGLGTEGKTVNLAQLQKIAMKAGNFGSDVKDALMDLYMAYEDKVPVVIVSKVLEKYDLTFKDLKDQPATFVPSSEFAHLFNSSTDKKVDEVSHSYDDRDEEMDDYLNSTDKEVDEPKTSNATSTYDIMMHMLDAGVYTRSEALEFFTLNHSDMPEQQVEFLTNTYFKDYQEEDTEDEVDESQYSKVLDLPNGQYFAIDGDWEDTYQGKNGLFFTIENGNIFNKEGEEFQVSPREFLSQFKPEEILKVDEEVFESVSLKDVL